MFIPHIILSQVNWFKNNISEIEGNMTQNIEQEREDLLRKIETNVDPQLLRILVTIADIHREQPKVEIVTSIEGTSNASTK